MAYPHETLRKSIQARTERALSKKPKPSPSEKKSASFRKHLARGAPVVEALKDDCRDCPNYPCGETLNTCGEKMVIDRCNKCGIKVRYRFIFGEFNYKCPVCRSER